MKKLAIVTIAALTALVICAAALAETAAADLYDGVVNLLFNTDNVTLNATVEFSLDGDWFKTAEITLMQDHFRSFRRLNLRSPRADGSERQNGYTIITEGDRLYLMEVFTPGIYRTGTSSERDSIIRRTVESEQLLGLGYALAGQANLLLGEGTVTKTEDRSFCIRLDDDAPALVNAALNQLFRFAAKRYFGMDYDRMSANSQMSLRSFGTLTEGILYTARNVSVRTAEITVKPDADGIPQHAEGKIRLYLETAADGVRQLDITFRTDVSGLGSTMVRKFNPDDYGVVPAEELTEEYGEYGAEDDGEPCIEEMQGGNWEFTNEITIKAMELWPETGFDMVSTTSASCSLRDNVYVVELTGGDGIVKRTFFDTEGLLCGIEAEPNDWQYRNISEYNYEPDPDPETDRKAKAQLMNFLLYFSPEMLGSVKDLEMEWIFETDGAVYAQYHEYPLDQEGDGVLFVIRLSPEMRIEYYSCISNG